MERLVTTSQAAEILGISLQGIHYRIKNKKLKSIKEGGKTYVYISQEYDKKTEYPLEQQSHKAPQNSFLDVPFKQTRSKKLLMT